MFKEINVIFCRNVLIYFDISFQKNLINIFSESLLPCGFLCVGMQESLNLIDTHKTYKPVIDNYPIYQKRLKKYSHV